MHGRTLYDKLWDRHVVAQIDATTALLYIDRHLVHEVSSPQAFAGLAAAGRTVRRPELHLALADHALPTVPRELPIPPGPARDLVARLEENAGSFGIPYLAPRDRRQGIVHVVGPEQGFTLPGTTLVCGDSHTCTHGAFGALAFGIGASESEVVLATQCLPQAKAKNMRVCLRGQTGPGVSVKDVVLTLIARIGTAGATGHAVEYAGDYVEGLSMEGRMTLCNMSIEAGAKIGLIAPDQRTFDYLEGRPMAPAGALWDAALDDWRTLGSDDDALFEREVEIDVATVAPHVTWGTSPQDAIPIDGLVPDPADEADPRRRARIEAALAYMQLAPSAPLAGTPIDRVFIGSCVNGRLEDLRAAAEILRGRRVAPGISAMVVPGSGNVRAAAEAEGLDRIFREAGFEWREAGCSMCVAMNGDRLAPGQRCASTSNRNFQGRQGPGGLTHLMSPRMAAAAAIAGRLVDARNLDILKDAAA